MPIRIDQSVSVNATAAGLPTAVEWENCWCKVRVLRTWPTVDDVQIYRIATELSGVPAIGEIARSGQDWTLRKWWRY